jgi:hypothetical protein
MDEETLLAGGDDGTFVPFTDMLFNVLLGLTFMVFTAFSLISPTAKTGAVDLKAEFIIAMTWPDNNPNDMDLYVEDPARQCRLVSFERGGSDASRPRRPRRASLSAGSERNRWRSSAS